MDYETQDRRLGLAEEPHTTKPAHQNEGHRHEGPLFDIRLVGNSIMFRLNPNSRINDLVETIGFKINKLLIDNIASKSRLEVLEFRKGNISIKLEATNFGNRYDFLISEDVEYSYNRNDIEKRRDPGFRYTGSRLVGTDTKIDYGYIKYDSFTLNLSSSQTEPDF